MRKMNWLILGLAVLFMSASFQVMAGELKLKGDARSLEILGLSRQAIGGERLNDVRGLGITAKLSRNGQEQAGQMKFFFHTSDNLDGDHNFDFMIRRRAEAGAAPEGEAKELKRKRVMVFKVDGKHEGKHAPMFAPGSTSMLLGLLLRPTLPVEFSFAGEETVDNIGTFVLDIKNPHGAVGKLYIDRSTYLPVMLSYRGLEPHVMILKDKDAVINEEKEVIIDGRHITPPDAAAEVVLRFSDHRFVDGVLLPHRMVKTINNDVQEEITIEKFELNPKLEIREPREVN